MINLLNLRSEQFGYVFADKGSAAALKPIAPPLELASDILPALLEFFKQLLFFLL